MSMRNSYTYQTPKGVAGGLMDISPYSIDSRVNGETDADALKFGMGAVQGGSPGVDVVVPNDADTADKFEGVVMTGYTNEMDMLGDVRIQHLKTVGILRYGKAWARIVKGITPAYGDALYLVNDGTDAGLFTNDATDTLEINGRFIGTAGTGDIAPVEIYNQKA